MSQFYVFYDLETGTLSPDEGDLLSGYFAVLNEDYKFLDELSLKLKPEGRLPIADPKALAVNKIDLKKHIEDPETVTYAQGKEKLVTLLKKYLKKNGRYSNLIFGGYNIKSFDNRWLWHHLIDKKSFENLVHYKYLDVMDDIDVLKRHGWLPPTIGTLGSCVEFFGVPKGEAHVAKDDIIMTLGVLKKVKELMDSKKNGGSTQDIIAQLESE